MNKKKFVTIIIVLLIIVAAGFIFTEHYIGINGKTHNVVIGQIDSSKFSSEEIDAAINSVIDKFEADFNGCELMNLWYDEKFSNTRLTDSNYDEDNSIVILSNFNVDSSGGDGSLNPNSTYTDWMWILTRNSEN